MSCKAHIVRVAYRPTTSTHAYPAPLASLSLSRPHLQTKEENKFLRRILPEYYKYMLANPDTLMTRFYGMHRVKVRLGGDESSIFFIMAGVEISNASANVSPC